jgi:hypothetical protein
VRPEPALSSDRPSTHWLRLAVTAWVLVLLVVCVRTVVQPRQHSTYPIFARAARQWLAGEDLYYKSRPRHGDLDDFRYSPVTAALVTPFTLVDERVAGVVWRLLGAAVLVGGLLWCCRAVFPLELMRTQRAVLFLLVLPLAAGNFNNGQTNTFVLGLVLCTFAGAAEKRWTLAAVCIAIASLMKIYPIAIGLLLVVLYPRQFTSRLLTAVGAGLALPFLLQRPDYVQTQYGEWVVCLLGDDRSVRPLDGCYRDFQLLWRVWLVPLSSLAYRAIEVASGALVALCCLAGRRADWPEIRLLNFVLALSCCWMTVFGPATESATYMLLAPVLGYAMIEAWILPEMRRLRWLLAADYSLFMVAQIEGWFGGGGILRPHGLQPIAGLLFMALVLVGHFAKTKIGRHEASPLAQAA